MTYTYSILKISSAAYEEIKQKLEDAGYSDQFHEDRNYGIVIDMHGIALAAETGNSFVRDWYIRSSQTGDTWLSAREDIKCGDFLGWNPETLECWRMIGKTPMPIGAAARDISCGEKIMYDPRKNTGDILVRSK